MNAGLATVGSDCAGAVPLSAVLTAPLRPAPVSLAARAALALARMHVQPPSRALLPGLHWRLDFLGAVQPQKNVRLVDSCYVGRNFESLLRFMGRRLDFEYITYGFRFAVADAIEVTVSRRYVLPFPGAAPHLAKLARGQHWMVEVKAVATEDKTEPTLARMKVIGEALAPVKLLSIDLADILSR